MKIIARPYPVAVPGEITKYEFNRKNKTLTLKFNSDESTRKKVEIYLPSNPTEIKTKCKYNIKPVFASEAAYISVGVSKGENTIQITL